MKEFLNDILCSVRETVQSHTDDAVFEATNEI